MSSIKPWALLWVPTEEEWLEEQKIQMMRSPCEANDEVRVRELYSQPPYDTSTGYSVVDLCLQDSNPNVALLRCLLEDLEGASAEKHAKKEIIKSVETLELLKEFGFDVSEKGHLILQYFAHSREILDWMLDHGVDINSTDYSRTDEGERLAGPVDTSLKILNSVAARGDIKLYDHLIARGADQSRSLGLHCASRCTDGEKSMAMINHLLDTYHMDIEFDNEELRNHFSPVADSGTPLQSALVHRNIPAINALLAQGAQPKYAAIVTAVGDFFSYGWLPALPLLLDAGADLGKAFDWAVLWGNVDAAKICLERGVDPTNALWKHRLRQARKAARMEAEKRSGDEVVEDEEVEEDERTPRCEGVGAEMEEFLELIR